MGHSKKVRKLYADGLIDRVKGDSREALLLAVYRDASEILKKQGTKTKEDKGQLNKGLI